jgi:ribose transport system ATP-binding protein
MPLSEHGNNPALHIKSLVLRPDAQPVNERVHFGEIVGLAGLDGQGQDHFLEALCGLQPALSGRVEAVSENGSTVEIKDFHTAVRAGIAYLPRNRKTQGILPPLSVTDNFSITTLDRMGRFGIINRRAVREKLAQYREQLSMVFASPETPISRLSGGNQQKVLLARWMAAEPRVMLLNDPTRGVDLPTRLKLYEVFRELVSARKTTLVILSTEVEELVQLCNRVLVFRDHTIFSALSGESITLSSIVAGMFGRHHEP